MQQENHTPLLERFLPTCFVNAFVPGYHCWWRRQPVILPEGEQAVEQLLLYVNMSILDRKDGTKNNGPLLQEGFGEQQGL